MSLTYDYLSNDQKRNTFARVDSTKNSNFLELDVATTSLKFDENELTTSVTKLMMKLVFLATDLKYKSNSRKTHFKEALLRAGTFLLILISFENGLKIFKNISLITETNIKIFKKQIKNYNFLVCT